MRLSEYVEYDATGLASLVKAGEIDSIELTRLAREANDEVNPRVNAVIEFYADAETIASVDTGLFNGVPFLRKDFGATEAGRLQEQGSRLFKSYRPNTDSYFFRRARNAGLRTVGRTTTPELAASNTTPPEVFHPLIQVVQRSITAARLAAIQSGSILTTFDRLSGAVTSVDARSGSRRARG